MPTAQPLPNKILQQLSNKKPAKVKISLTYNNGLL